MSGTQRQHYISRSLIKRWAEDGKVGVVCLYHRDSAEVSAKARTLHSVVDLWPQDLEDSWHPAENAAAHTIDEIERLLASNGDDFDAMERMVSEPRSFSSLIELAVLHHARALTVLIQQIADIQNGVASPDTAARIQGRWEEAQAYHDCGLVVTVLPADEPIGLNAVPVFHAPRWGGPKPEAPVLFMMPLSPRIMICGVPEMDTGDVSVETEQIGEVRFSALALAGEPGIVSTPWLICKPSALDQTAQAVLSRSEGGAMHWLGLCDRMDRYWDDADVQRQIAWRRLRRDYETQQKRHDASAGPNSRSKRHHRAMRDMARGLQAELDGLDAPLCNCDSRRDRKADPEMASRWDQVMPKTICQEIRSKRNTAARGL